MRKTFCDLCKREMPYPKYKVQISEIADAGRCVYIPVIVNGEYCSLSCAHQDIIKKIAENGEQEVRKC
jgi:hypothetical protein